MKRLIRGLLIAAILLLTTSPASAAIAIIDSVSAGSSDNTVVTTAAIDSTGATLLVCGVASYDVVASPTVTDSKSNTWTPLTDYFTAVGGQNRARIFYAANPGSVGSSHTFTATESGSYPAIACLALSGAATASPFDQENGTSPTSGESVQPGSVTPSEDNEILITVLALGATGTGASINGGFAIQESVPYGGGTNFSLDLATLIQTSATAANPTWSWTGSEAHSVGIATFKASGGGGGGGAPPVGSLGLLGVGR